MASEPIPIAVVGAGHLGKHHARLLHGLDSARLVAVVDTRREAAEEIAGQYGARALTDHRELIGEVAAACVVTPTASHRAIAGELLENGIDVLVEKPIAPNGAQGRELVAIAARHDRVLQVGHVERFNPAFSAVRELGLEPRYVETQRLAPFSFRSVDIGVVLDLMVHDIDIVVHLVGSPVKSVEAFGGAVFTPAEDMATATLRFENGAVAQLTTSRIALKPARRIRLFSPKGYASLDFQDAKGMLIRKSDGWDYEKLDLSAVNPSEIDDLWQFVFDGLLTVKHLELDVKNALQDELAAFLDCVRDRSVPEVTGEDGCLAVEIAEQVLAAIGANSW